MASFSFPAWIRSQRKPLPPVRTVDLTGRTIVVTGGNTGLGFEAAKHLARMRPAKLVIACRSQAKGDVALAELARETGYARGEVMLIDMASFASVSAFAEEFARTHDRLDILVANAGVGAWEYQASKDGWELSMQVNHLSTALLSLLLLPYMIRKAQTHDVYPQIAVVASEVHFFTKFGKDKDVLASPGILTSMSDPAYCTKSVMNDRYNFTKLLNIMFVRCLNAHLPQGSPVVVTSLTPGFCLSAFRRDMPFPLSLMSRLMELTLARTTEMGSRTLVAAALVGEGDAALRDSARGAYMDSCRIAQPSAWLDSKDGTDAKRRIWEETVQILEKSDPKVREAVDKYLTSGA